MKIKLISQTTLETLSFNQQEYSMEDTLVYAYNIGSEFHLRTMDTLQIASAIKIRIYSGIDLQYFLTNDQNIVDKSNQIHQKARILPISSTSLLNDLSINETKE